MVTGIDSGYRVDIDTVLIRLLIEIARPPLRDGEHQIRGLGLGQGKLEAEVDLWTQCGLLEVGSHENRAERE
jgi:hypothetical protein